MSIDVQYNALVNRVLKHGHLRSDRTGVGTRSIFGHYYKVDLRNGFPLLTTKKINLPLVYHELNWFLRGDTNINTLKAPQLWSAWADETGEMGYMYGKMWREWGSPGSSEYFDQIASLIKLLKTDPTSRRMVVSAWNPFHNLNFPQIPSACHTMFQCYVEESLLKDERIGKNCTGCGVGNLINWSDWYITCSNIRCTTFLRKEEKPVKYLDLQLYQRSADIAVGVPFNIASYAILMCMLAQECGMVPRYFHHSIGDAHIYNNHRFQLERQVQRPFHKSPRLVLKDKSFWDLVKDDDSQDISLFGYVPQPFIKYDLAK